MHDKNKIHIVILKIFISGFNSLKFEQTIPVLSGTILKYYRDLLTSGE